MSKMKPVKMSYTSLTTKGHPLGSHAVVYPHSPYTPHTPVPTSIEIPLGRFSKGVAARVRDEA